MRAAEGGFVGGEERVGGARAGEGGGSVSEKMDLGV
jgi:hypothetical protein